MVGKYDGSKHDSACLSCVLNGWFQKAERTYMGYWCSSSFGYSIFWCSGYSLPWDQVGYWACKIVTGVPEAIPVVGSLLVEVLRGGVSVGQSTLTRFYSAHTFVLPVVAAVLMLTHFVMIRKQGISGPL